MDLMTETRRAMAVIEAASLTTAVNAWLAGGKKQPNNPPKPEPTPRPVPLRPAKKGEASTIMLGRGGATPMRPAVDPVIAAQAEAAVAEANRRAALLESFKASADAYNKARGF